MKLHFLFVASISLFLSSCAQQSLTGDTYSRGEAGRAQSVSEGEITSIRNVAIQGNSTAGGLIAGIAGGILGNEIGSGNTANNLGALGGAAAGAALGSRAQQALGTKQGLEITVKLDNGRSISAVQEFNKRESFSVGERVRVLSNGRTTRIVH